MANSDLAEVWARSLDGLADLQIQPHQRAWLKLTRPLGLVENTALIATPNEFVKEQLETRLRALVTQALSQQLGRDIQLAVTVDPAPQATMPAAGPADLAAEPPAPRLQGLAGPQAPEADLGSRLGPPAPGPHAHPYAGPGEPARAGTWATPIRGARRARRDARRPPGSAAPGSTPSTPSRRSSSARATGSRTRPRSRSPRPRPRRTTRCSSTATPAWARRTCCTRSGTTRRPSTPA